jgi:ubiquitin-activating enzyme E1
LKNFPTKIEHCIEFSKNIFNELFQQYIRNLKLFLEDEEQFQNILNQISNLEELYLSIQIYKYIIDIINNPSQYSIIKFAIFIFIYYFEYNINTLLKELKDSFNKRPSPLEIIDLNEENTKLYFESFYYIFCDIINLRHNNYNIIDTKTEISKERKNIVINTENLDSQELIHSFNKEILGKIKKNENNKIREKINVINPIKFEKDDDENYHINFILSFSNLRASNYFIEPSNFLTVKEIAGNIIPAIASTTAAVTGIACLQIYTILLTDDIKYFKNISFNLAVSGFDLSTPEEKRTITNIPKTERSAAIQVIPREYTVWDKLDLYGPNLKIKNIVDDFKNKYNVDVDYINYKDNTLASPFDDEDEDLDKSVEDLLKEKTKFNLNEKSKYVELEITGSIGNNEISTPTIRYILKGSVCRQFKN